MNRPVLSRMQSLTGLNSAFPLLYTVLMKNLVTSSSLCQFRADSPWNQANSESGAKPATTK